MPEEGINIVSVLLHAHGTARKISLKHIRGTEELPRISEVVKLILFLIEMKPPIVKAWQTYCIIVISPSFASRTNHVIEEREW